MKFFFLSFLMLFLTNGCRDAQEELRAQALRDRQVITDLKDSKWEKVEMRLGNDQWHSSAEISKIEISQKIKIIINYIPKRSLNKIWNDIL